MSRALLLAALLLSVAPARGQSAEGYYRYPTLHGDLVVFCAEGDLWTVPTGGGSARRLTTHPGEEIHPVISPDGRTVAFTAAYEGPAELYTMSLDGGLPTRWTYEAEPSVATTWTPAGDLVYTTSHYSTLPDLQLVALDLETGRRRRVPLSQASEGAYDSDGATLFFVRPAFHRQVTRRYRGGTARQIWRFVEGADEAELLTTDHRGESHTPMWWNGRLYFITDRDGTMNIWSMAASGGDLQQHTEHSGWDVRDASLNEGRIVYQVGADLWLYDIARDRSRMLSITLASDFDQLRERWVKTPMDYLTSVHLHPEGESVVLTARGRVFVAPAKQGRLSRVSREKGVRYRDAVFMPDGGTILALSDATGELEFVTVPATGIGDPDPVTRNGTTLRFQGHPSPDGKWIAYTDNNKDLWLLSVESREQRVLSTNREGVGDIAWAPDSRWLTFSQQAANSYVQILLYRVDGESPTALTSDRVNSRGAVWSPDGEWIYFLSDRNVKSIVRSPWGPRQPEAYFDKPVKVYQVALRKGLRSPFKADDELYTPPEDEDTEGDEGGRDEKDGAKKAPSPVEIDLEGLPQRVREVPIEAGSLGDLALNEKAIFWTSHTTALEPKTSLMALKIGNEKPKPETLVEDVNDFELSADGKRILVRRKDDLFVFDAGVKAPEELDEKKVDLGSWTFPIDVREDWRQIFVDAWRMERDYFYDPNMHGVSWEAVRDKYLPLVERVTTRDELSDLIGRVVGELSALHTAVRGGDHRKGPDEIKVPTLGARLVRGADGDRVDHVYRSDPDFPEELSPLADPDLGIEEGDVIESVNGTKVLSVPDIGALLRGQGGRQVRLRVKDAEDGEGRDVVVIPTDDEDALRYRDWEHTRRMRVDEAGGGRIGYVHLRAMGGQDIDAWYRQFYPVFNRQGLILDFRHNRGGNIDSLVLEKLLRRAWFYWKPRVGEPTWNMQYAFRGHLVALCDHNTASDGEAVVEGFRRLGLGKLIGTRTWGGEIWLSGVNRLSDGGIATAPMLGVYGPEGEWLIEGRGVEPDVVVDNLPHATFDGQDAQLDAAVAHLLEEIQKDPRLVPAAPSYPDKSFRYPE